MTFAVQRATGTKLGTFVTITGGPGVAGVSQADDYADYWDPKIAKEYDIVFLDQRGTGLSHLITCPAATSTYYGSDADPEAPSDAAAVKKAASTYVSDCLTEAKADPADLPFYATTQAIEDLEAVRQYLDADKLQLYGESYGTQFVQTYAAKYPQHINSLFIDGPVDLVPDGVAYYEEAARAWNDVVVSEAGACKAATACRLDTAAGDPLAAYDALIAKLEKGPITVRFPTAAGTFVDRPLAKTNVEFTAEAYGYGPFERALFLRALTAASKGDYVPMLRAFYDSIVVDPETLKTIPDPTYSDAMYYSTECQDYAFYLGGGSADARAQAWLDDGAKTGINDLRLGSTFYGDMPCVYWPVQPKTDPRPTAIENPPYPTFIMTATSDPATPIANAMRLYGRLPDAYFIEALGGDHVIFGRGDECPDKMITAYLVSGTLPATRVTTCANDYVDPYVANARPRATNYPSALSLMSSMEDQISNTDDYSYRLDKDPITMGCYLGGTLRYEPVDGGTKLTLNKCAFTRGAPMTGSGKIDDNAGTFRLKVRLGGRNRLNYFDNADGVKSVTGSYRGKPVNQRR